MRTLQTARKSKDESKDESNGTSPMDGESTPTITTPASPPVTPTPQTLLLHQQSVQVAIPDPTETLTTPEKPLQRDSLTSSRPAPPSPALSRRTSTALSRHSVSSVRSRPSSRVTSLSQPPENALEPNAPSSSAAPPKRRSFLLQVRDFAYPQSDERHYGRGPEVPRPNRVRHRGSTSSVSSSSADDSAELDEDEQHHSSWSPFRWNTLSSHFWGGRDTDAVNDTAAGPSRTDFDRNFEASSPAEEEPEPSYDEFEDAYDEEYVSPGEDEPLAPGTYRALYPFEPEGTAEMALEEDQIVHVVGRGGGVGWAIVEKEGGGHALVPESYLELVKANNKDATDAY